MRRLWALPLALCCGGCHRTPTTPVDPIGLWSADLASHPGSSSTGLWSHTKLRIKKDGTFQIYGELAGEGTYRTLKSKLHLDYTHSWIPGSREDYSKDRLSELRLDVVADPVGLNTYREKDHVLASRWVRWDPASIEALLAEADDPRNPDMEFARDELVGRGKAALPVLIHSLQTSGNPQNFMRAAVLLGRTKLPEAAPPLIQELDRYDAHKPFESCTPQEKMEWMTKVNGIMMGLGYLKDRKATPALIRYATAQQVDLGMVLIALGKIGDPEALDFLEMTLKSPTVKLHPGMTAYVIEAMGRIGDRRALPAILSWKSSDDPRTLIAISEAIPKIEKDPAKAKQFVPGLLTALTKLKPELDSIDPPKPGDPAFWVKSNSVGDVCSVIIRLGDIGDPRVIAALVDLLDATQIPVVSAAAGALGKLKAKQAIPKLSELSMDKRSHVRDAAIEALRAIQ